jgi:orotidine-5'-phosphate decarboxylase
MNTMNVNHGLSIAGTEAQPFHFGDALTLRTRSLGHCFCLGLDPHLSLIPAAFRRGNMNPHSPTTIEALEDFLVAVVDRAIGRTVAIKPQSAMYERLGSAGVALLERVVAYAHSRDMLVLLDAKRGDIAATADAYAEAYLMPDSPNPVDGLTVNPYMGSDTLEPFLKLSSRYGRGVFVLVKTSNPGSGEFQDLAVGATTVFGTVARALAPYAERLRGSETGWSSLGVVVGATYPGEAEDIRRTLPSSLFLTPGFGHQNGDLDKIVSSLVPGPSCLEGGLISSSRATLFPPQAMSQRPELWKFAFDDQLARTVQCVTAACMLQSK